MKKYIMTIGSGINKEVREGTALHFYNIADSDCVAEFECHLEEYLEKECEVICDQSLLDMASEYFSIMSDFADITVEAI